MFGGDPALRQKYFDALEKAEQLREQADEKLLLARSERDGMAICEELAKAVGEGATKRGRMNPKNDTHAWRIKHKALEEKAKGFEAEATKLQKEADSQRRPPRRPRRPLSRPAA